MITIVSLNPCIDWQYNISTFTYGGMNRVRRTYQSAASKGTNTAIVLKNLGHTPFCTGFNFVEGGENVTNKLNALNIPHGFLTIDGSVRVNIKLFEEETGTMTELNQPGEFVPEVYVKTLKEKIEALSKHSGADGTLVLSGSLPAGVPKDIYAILSGLWHGKVVLDAEGDALRLAIESPTPPYAIKPNLFELESTFNVKLQTPQEVADYCHKNIIDKGISFVCVSMGADGAVLVTPYAAYFCPAVSVTVRGLQGAGDSMVAGLIHGFMTPVAEPDLLRYAIAAATASVTREGTDLCTGEDFRAIIKKVPPQYVVYL